MTILFIYDNDIPDLYVGKTVRQGEVFYQEGTKGNATGNHIHMNKSVIGLNPDLIKPGQVLIIPKSEATYYIVVKGDTLIKVTKKYKTTWQKIYKDNKKNR